MALSKFQKRMLLSKSGRVPWTRRELEAWLQHLNKTYVDDEDNWDSMRESAFYLCEKYGQKGTLWVGRVMAIMSFMHRFGSRLHKDGLIEENKHGQLLSRSLLEAFAKLPMTNPRTGFSYKTVRDYVASIEKPN